MKTSMSSVCIMPVFYLGVVSLSAFAGLDCFTWFLNRNPVAEQSAVFSKALIPIELLLIVLVCIKRTRLGGLYGVLAFMFSIIAYWVFLERVGATYVAPTGEIDLSEGNPLDGIHGIILHLLVLGFTIYAIYSVRQTIKIEQYLKRMAEVLQDAVDRSKKDE